MPKTIPELLVERLIDGALENGADFLKEHAKRYVDERPPRSDLSLLLGNVLSLLMMFGAFSAIAYVIVMLATEGKSAHALLWACLFGGIAPGGLAIHFFTGGYATARRDEAAKRAMAGFITLFERLRREGKSSDEIHTAMREFMKGVDLS